MQGTRIRLEYFDQNAAFADCLPRSGTLTRRLAIDRWGDDWYVLQLDEPFAYQGRQHQQVLIRSRWQGYALGGPEPTSVFILLIPRAAALDKPLPKAEDFEHVTWGMAHTLGR